MSRGRQNKTEFTRIRESYGFNQKEVAERMGIAESGYSLLERDARKSSQKRKDRFLYDLYHVCEELLRERREKSYDLELNSYVKTVEHSCEDEEIQDELNMKLYYQPVTEEIFEKALDYIEKGYTLVKAAVILEVDEEELGNKLKRRGFEFEEGNDYL